MDAKKPVVIQTMEHERQGIVKVTMSSGRVYHGPPEVLLHKVYGINNRPIPVPPETSEVFQALMATAYPDEAAHFFKIIADEKAKYDKQKGKMSA